MHNKLQAKLLLDATLVNLDNYDLKPTPNNYRLWFEYAAGTIQSLSTDIDTMLSQQLKISEKICNNLYIKHLTASDQREVDDARIAIGGMLNTVINHLKTWGSYSDSYGATLNNCIKRLNTEPSLAEIKEILDVVIDESKRVRDANLAVKSTLSTLSDEIMTLRKDVSQLGNEALTDALTATMNRRGFDDALKTSITNSQQQQRPCAIIVIDLDDFKDINDNFGHKVGDKILRFAAASFRKSIRGNDILARYGGEEFAIILPETSYQGAMRVAENLRLAVSAKQLTTGSNGKVIGHLTVSLGVTSYQQGESCDSFFERADKYMYRAKGQGKNRVMGGEAA